MLADIIDVFRDEREVIGHDITRGLWGNTQTGGKEYKQLLEDTEYIRRILTKITNDQIIEHTDVLLHYDAEGQHIELIFAVDEYLSPIDAKFLVIKIGQQNTAYFVAYMTKYKGNKCLIKKTLEENKESCLMDYLNSVNLVELSLVK